MKLEFNTLCAVLAVAAIVSCNKPEAPVTPEPGPETPEVPEVPEEPEKPEEPAFILPEMVDIPAGSFLMGDASASGENIDEKPVHTVTFSKGFKMGKFEVTNAEYEKFDPTHKRGKETSSSDDEAVVSGTSATKVMGEDGILRNQISDETMEYVGILAKLELSPEEMAAARKDMEEMLDYIDQLNELDTTGIEPMSHVFAVNNAFREDVIVNGDGSAATLSNAPIMKNGGFKVPKTIGE